MSTSAPRWARRAAVAPVVALIALAAAALLAGLASPSAPVDDYVVFGANDLGMHCMNQDFSELMILPPYNTLHAQVIDRTRDEPEVLDEDDVIVRYVVPSNTRSTSKTNFWRYARALLGVDLPPDVGLAGFGLSGRMQRTGNGDYQAVGIPITPIEDSGHENPYPLAYITVERGGAVRGRTQAVVPVSWEISCNICHSAPGISPARDILLDHDRLHNTDLANSTPVMCAQCHADPALNAPGNPDLPTLSGAMHLAHANRMDEANLDNSCYACHPGLRTQCQRDVHLARGLQCVDCHGGMNDVGNPKRTPWLDQPSCASCHQRPGFEFEEPNKLFRESRGHGGVTCLSCHGSPHAITPTVTAADNLQAIRLQGHPGAIDSCDVCHRVPPEDDFFHRREK